MPRVLCEFRDYFAVVLAGELAGVLAGAGAGAPEGALVGELVGELVGAVAGLVATAEDDPSLELPVTAAGVAAALDVDSPERLSVL